MAEPNVPGKGTEALKYILECPICFETAKPPIYACVTGHLICKDCHPKVTRCPMCQSRYTGTRSFVAEELYTKLNADHSLVSKLHRNEDEPQIAEHINKKNLESSLTAEEDIAIEQLLRISDAQYADDPYEFCPIKCCLFTDNCNNSTVDFFSYIDHLRIIHQVYSTDAGIRSFEKRQDVEGNRYVKGGPQKMFIMNCFERSFLINFHQEEEFVWIWAALHGSQEETPDFTVQLTIKHAMLEDIKWEGTVHGIRKTVEQIGASSSVFMRVNISDLKERLVNLGWTVLVQISRRSPNPNLFTPRNYDTSPPLNSIVPPSSPASSPEQLRRFRFRDHFEKLRTLQRQRPWVKGQTHQPIDGIASTATKHPVVDLRRKLRIRSTSSISSTGAVCSFPLTPIPPLSLISQEVMAMAITNANANLGNPEAAPSVSTTTPPAIVSNSGGGNQPSQNPHQNSSCIQKVIAKNSDEAKDSAGKTKKTNANSKVSPVGLVPVPSTSSATVPQNSQGNQPSQNPNQSLSSCILKALTKNSHETRNSDKAKKTKKNRKVSEVRPVTVPSTSPATVPPIPMGSQAVPEVIFLSGGTGSSRRTSASNVKKQESVKQKTETSRCVIS